MTMRLTPAEHALHSFLRDVPGRSGMQVVDFDGRCSVRGNREPGTRLLAQGEGRRVLLVETVGAERLPDYRVRRVRRLELSAEVEDAVVFTDAAHSTFVWTALLPIPGTRTASRLPFGSKAESQSLYVEFRIPGDEALIATFARGVPANGCVGEARMRGWDAVEECLTDVFAGAPSAVAAPPIAPLEVIEGTTDADAIRAIFRNLDRVVVFDPRCESSDWLLGAADALSYSRLAAVHRVRALLADSAYHDDSRRPEYLSDLRRLAAPLDSPDLTGLGPFPIRRYVLQRRVFGWAPDRSSAMRIREELLLWAGIPTEATCRLDVNVQVASSPEDRASRSRESGGNSGEAVVSPTRVQRDLESLAFAWGLLSDARLGEGASNEEWRRAGTMIERRRQRLANDFARAPTGDRPYSEWLSKVFPVLDRRDSLPLIVVTPEENKEERHAGNSPASARWRTR